MPSRRPLVAGNWKMHGLKASVAQFEYCDVGIGARFEGSDRSFIAEDLGRSGGTADNDLVEWKAKGSNFDMVVWSAPARRCSVATVAPRSPRSSLPIAVRSM